VKAQTNLNIGTGSPRAGLELKVYRNLDRVWVLHQDPGLVHQNGALSFEHKLLRPFSRNLI